VYKTEKSSRRSIPMIGNKAITTSYLN